MAKNKVTLKAKSRKPNATKKVKRKSIPENIKLKVWSEAGGRCQFLNCNKPLWYNELTLSDTNFGEIAHIIGASRKGPRGIWDSPNLQDDPNNLMLLCQTCHTEIDYGSNIEWYPAEVLTKMKDEHAKIVRIALEQPGKKTTIVLFKCGIGKREIIIDKGAIRKAIFPYFPDQPEHSWFQKSLSFFDRSIMDSWKNGKNEINSLFDEFNRYSKNNTVSSLSIFALGPMPLLIYLGKRFGDTIPSKIFQPNRQIDDLDKRWCWEEGESTVDYKIKETEMFETKNVSILLSLSDKITEQKYASTIEGDEIIYEIYIDEPSPHFLRRNSDIENFSKQFRLLLNKIQELHGTGCNVKIFPAAPASICIEIGRVLIPTKDPKITVCEFYEEEMAFKPVLDLQFSD